MRGTRRQEQRGGIIFKFLFLCTFLACLVALYLVRHPLMRVAGRMLIVDDSPRASDAIVMLGDDNYNADRATKAAALLKAGWAPRVVASGRYLRPYISVADLEQRDLTQGGVPASAIVRFPSRAQNTREECTAISGLLAEKGWKHILLVTSNYHTRRTRYICSRLLPPGTELHVIPAPDAEFNPDDWWRTRQGDKLFYHEVVGLAAAAWELRDKSVQTQE